MNSEPKMTEDGVPAMAGLGSVTIPASGVRAMRHSLHELANVFTGVMIAGGLLAQFLEAESLRGYAGNICESSERGAELVREIRSQLLACCGELEAAARSDRTPGAGLGQ